VKKKEGITMDTHWTCDTCGEKIISPEEGLIEWHSFDDEKGIHRCRNLRLVHEFAASPLRKMKLKRRGCAFDLHEEFCKTEGTITDQPLAKFLGPEGLMYLLSFIAEGEFPVAEILKMIKRLHIPGYELARDYFRAAVSAGVIEPCTTEDYYDQRNINAVLKWLEEKRR
jgi:hypothetical protein